MKEITGTKEIILPPSGEEIKNDREIDFEIKNMKVEKENPEVPQGVDIKEKEMETNEGKE